MPRTVEPFDEASPNDINVVYEGDFRRILKEGETLSSPEVIVDPSGGLTVGSPSVVGTRVQVRLGGGTAGTKYFIVFKAVTSENETLERTTSLQIGEEYRPLT